MRSYQFSRRVFGFLEITVWITIVLGVIVGVIGIQIAAYMIGEQVAIIGIVPGALLGR